MDTEQLTQQLDPVFKAQWLFRQHKWDDCIALCTELLAANPYDQAVWYLKTRALTLRSWVDDTEIDEEVRRRPAAPGRSQAPPAPSPFTTPAHAARRRRRRPP
jgi:hypothetical protein